MSLEHSPARQKKLRKGKHSRVPPQPQPIEPNAFYRADQLAKRWGVHPMTIWSWSRQGNIPRPAKLGPNVSRWLGSEVLAHEQRCQQQ